MEAAPRLASKTRKRVQRLTSHESLLRVAISAQAIAHGVETIMRERGADVPFADMVVLQQLANRSGASQMGWMARQLGVSRQRIQKQVDMLAQIGHVEVQVDSADRRARTIRLTPLG